MLPIESQSGINGGYYKELSDFKYRNGRIFFPKHYYEDYYVDFFDENNIDVDTKDWSIKGDENDIDLLRTVRSESYSATIWYPAIKKFTYQSELIPIKDTLEKALQKVHYPAFIKLDSISAKDANHSCIFQTAEEVLKIFSESGRIRNALSQKLLSRNYHHLFVREIDYKINDYPHMRCFVYHGKLTAISCPEIISEENKNIIDNFIHLILPDLPYQNATIDIVLKQPFVKQPTVIEVNNFGVDSPAAAELFNWKEDYAILHGYNDTVVWKHKNYYEF